MLIIDTKALEQAGFRVHIENERIVIDDSDIEINRNAMETIHKGLFELDLTSIESDVIMESVHSGVAKAQLNRFIKVGL